MTSDDAKWRSLKALFPLHHPTGYNLGMANDASQIQIDYNNMANVHEPGRRQQEIQKRQGSYSVMLLIHLNSWKVTTLKATPPKVFSSWPQHPRWEKSTGAAHSKWRGKGKDRAGIPPACWKPNNRWNMLKRSTIDIIIWHHDTNHSILSIWWLNQWQSTMVHMWFYRYLVLWSWQGGKQ